MPTGQKQQPAEKTEINGVLVWQRVQGCCRWSVHAAGEVCAAMPQLDKGWSVGDRDTVRVKKIMTRISESETDV